MIHIVFNEPDIAVLQAAIELDETMQGEVLLIRDDLAVGPLLDIYKPEGIEARKQWWREVLAGGDYDGLVEKEVVDDQKVVAELLEKLTNNPEEKVWIWAAQNKHDVSGYFWMLQFLKEYQARIFILYLNNLPFINEKGLIFYPQWLSQIPPKEFLKAKKLARPITLSEFEVDPDEWAKLCADNKGVRLLEGGKKLAQEDYDFYDQTILSFASKDWQKGSKLINQVLNKAKHTTGDAYLLWRLKGLINAGKLDAQGELKNMKDFEVRAKSAAAVSADSGQQ